MEYFIVSGSFYCNGEKLGKGDYVVYREGSVMNWSSISGGLMLIVLRGDVVKLPAQRKPNSVVD